MIVGRENGSNVRGNRPYLMYGPHEVGLFNVSFVFPNTVSSRQLNVEGFAHFQICCEVGAAVNIQLTLSRGEVSEPGWTSRASLTRSNILTTFTGTPGYYNTFYWGLNLEASTGRNDKFRFARTLQLAFGHQNGPATTLTAWLECMG